MSFLLLSFVSLQYLPRGYAQTPSSRDNLKQQVVQLQKLNQPSCPPASPQHLPKELKYACRDLATLACKPGESNDGTGTYRATEEVESEVTGLQEKLQAKLTLSIAASLNNQDSKFYPVRALALAATQQEGKPVCLSQSIAEIKACHLNAATLLANAISKNALFDFKSSNWQYGSGLLFNDRVLNLKAFEKLQSNRDFQKIINPIIETSERTLVQSAQSEKIKTIIFPRVKKLMLEKINHSVADPKIRKVMMDKVSHITFNGTECSERKVDGQSVNSIFVKNAYYSNTTQEFRFCNGILLETTSEFTLAATIAHELTHSIDPCNLAKTPELSGLYTDLDNRAQCEKEYPFQNLISCLRTENSVGASRSDWTVQKKFRSYDKKVFPNFFCDRDQIGETVSDWMSAEILPDYLERYHPGLTLLQKVSGYANVLRYACESEKSTATSVEDLAPTFDPHPRTEDRVNRIWLANNRVFKSMGCIDSDRDDKAAVYCALGGPVVGKSKEDALERAADEKAEKLELKINKASVKNFNEIKEIK